jgi:hypothetical protein
VNYFACEKNWVESIHVVPPPPLESPEKRSPTPLVKVACTVFLTTCFIINIVYGSVYVYIAALTPKEGDAMQTAEKLVRKQFLIYPTQAKKIELIAKRQKTSVAEMVRKAIDAFNPDALSDMADSELLELVRARVKEAIMDTKKTRERLSAALNRLEV